MADTFITPVVESTPFQLKDGWARLIGIPAIALVMMLIFHPAEMETNGMTLTKGYLVSLVYTVFYWEGIRRLWLFLLQRYSHYSQTKTRLTQLIVSILLYGIVANLAIQLMAAATFQITCTWPMLVAGYFCGLVPTLVVLTFYETVYFFVSWKNKVIETEAISRTQMQTQLDALKNQLDPHFLFNSLNTLSSLINENEPAQQYLTRLADVYRYVLLSKDRNTVTLKEEIDFAQAFLYLAKVRFRHGLEVTVNVPEAALAKLIAPLSVQLLLENALKHNVVSREKPLHVHIAAEGDYLRVRNELQPKVHLESGTKVGLKNILARYRLLTERPVEIVNDSVHFEVSLPLIPALR